MQVEFVSPETILYSGEGTMVVARTRGGGEIAFLQGHEPFIGSLQTSEVKVTEAGGEVRHFAVRGGFVSVTGEKVTVLSDLAVSADAIDRVAAEADLADAQRRIDADAEDEFAIADKRWAELRILLA